MRLNFFHNITESEQRVNDIALKIVITDKQFKNAIQRTTNVKDLAKLFSVPEMAIYEKAKKLGYYE